MRQRDDRRLRDRICTQICDRIDPAYIANWANPDAEFANWADPDAEFANWADPDAEFANWADPVIWSPKSTSRRTDLPSLHSGDPDLPSWRRKPGTNWAHWNRPSPKLGRTGPDRTEPGRTEPGQTEPDRTGPGQTEPGQTEPGQTEPDRTGPGQTGPGRPGRPGRTGHQRENGPSTTPEAEAIGASPGAGTPSPGANHVTRSGRAR